MSCYTILYNKRTAVGHVSRVPSDYYACARNKLASKYRPFNMLSNGVSVMQIDAAVSEI